MSSSCPILTIFLLFSTAILLESCQYKGTTYSDGDEWVVERNFLMNCTNDGASWSTEIVACQTENGLRVDIGQAVTEAKKLWTCYKDGQGDIRMSSKPDPNATCIGGYKSGEVWTAGNFEYTCVSGGLRQVSACLAHSGRRVPVNSSIVDAHGYKTECKTGRDGAVTLSASRVQGNQIEGGTIGGCRDAQITHSYGSHWIDQNGKFNKTCSHNGGVSVVNCITDSGNSVPINGQLVMNNVRYTCSRAADGSVTYDSRPV